MADEWKTLLAKSQRDIEKALESDFSGADQARKDIELRASLEEAKYKRSPEYMQKQIDSAAQIEKVKAQAWAERDKLQLGYQKELAEHKASLDRKLAKGGFTKSELDLHLNRVSHPDPEIDRYLKNKVKGYLAENRSMPMNLNAWTAARIKEYQKYWGEEPAGAPGATRRMSGPNPTVSESLVKGGSAAIGKAAETIGGLAGLAGTGIAHAANIAGLGLPGMAYEAYTGKDTSFSNPVESAGELGSTAFELLKSIPYGLAKGAQEIASTGAEFLGGMAQDVANTGTGESFQGPGYMPERIEAAMAEAAAYIAGEEDPEEIRKFITDPEIGSGIVQGLAHMHADITGGSVDDSLDILAGELAAQPDIVFMIPDLLGAWKYYRAGGFTGMQATRQAAEEAAAREAADLEYARGHQPMGAEQVGAGSYGPSMSSEAILGRMDEPRVSRLRSTADAAAMDELGLQQSAFQDAMRGPTNAPSSGLVESEASRRARLAEEAEAAARIPSSSLFRTAPINSIQASRAQSILDRMSEEFPVLDESAKVDLVNGLNDLFAEDVSRGFSISGGAGMSEVDGRFLLSELERTMALPEGLSLKSLPKKQAARGAKLIKELAEVWDEGLKTKPLSAAMRKAGDKKIAALQEWADSLPSEAQAWRDAILRPTKMSSEDLLEAQRLSGYRGAGSGAGSRSLEVTRGHDEFARGVAEALDGDYDAPAPVDRSGFGRAHARQLGQIPGENTISPPSAGKGGKQSPPLAVREVPASLASAEDLARAAESVSQSERLVLDAVASSANQAYSGLSHLGEVAESIGMSVSDISKDLLSLQKKGLIQMDMLDDPRVLPESKRTPDQLLRTRYRGDLAFASVAKKGEDTINSIREWEKRRWSKEMDSAARSHPDVVFEEAEKSTEYSLGLLELEADKIARAKLEIGEDLGGAEWSPAQKVRGLGVIDAITHALQIADKTPFAGAFRVIAASVVESTNAAIGYYKRYTNIMKEHGITDADDIATQKYVSRSRGVTHMDPIEHMRQAMAAKGDERLFAYYMDVKENVFDKMALYLPPEKRRRLYWQQRPPAPPPIAGIDIPRGAMDALVSSVHDETYRMRAQTGPGAADTAGRYWMYDSIREFMLHRSDQVGGPVPMMKRLMEEVSASNAVSSDIKTALNNSLMEAMGQRIGSAGNGNLQYWISQRLTRLQKGAARVAEIDTWRNKYEDAIKELDSFVTDGRGMPLPESARDAAFKKRLAALRKKVGKASEKLKSLTKGTAHEALFDIFGSDPAKAILGVGMGSFVGSVLGFKTFAHMAMNTADLAIMGPMLAGKSFFSNPIRFYMDAAKGLASGIQSSSAMRRVFGGLIPGKDIDFTEILERKWLQPASGAGDLFGNVIDDIGDSWPQHRPVIPRSERALSKAVAAGGKVLTKANEVALMGLEGFEEVLNHSAAYIADGIFQNLWKKHAKKFPNGEYNVDALVDNLSTLNTTPQLRRYWKELGQSNPRALRNEYAKWFVEEVFVGRTVFNRISAFSGLRMASDVLGSAMTQRALLFTRHPGQRIGQIKRMMANGVLTTREGHAALAAMAVGGATAYSLMKTVHPGEDPGYFYDEEKGFSPAAKRTAAYSIFGTPYEIHQRMFGEGYDSSLGETLVKAIPGVGLGQALHRTGEQYRREEGKKLLGAVIEPQKKWKRVWVADDDRPAKSRSRRRPPRRKKRRRKRER